jgi:hypothetical protein
LEWKDAGVRWSSHYTTGEVGEGASLWADALIENRPEMAMRILQGLLSKRKKHSKHQIDEACKKALFNGQFRLREIEQLLLGKSEQQRLEFISEHELIRSADSYEQVFATKELF